MKFRLESILSLKKNVEQMKKKELADAYAQKDVLISKKDLLVTEDEKLDKQLKAEISGNINPLNISHVSNYKRNVNKSIDKVEKEIEGAEKNILEKQQNLVDAMKARKILDNLKEMHFQKEMEEFRQEEQKLIDEIVGYRYIITTEGGE